MKINVLHSLILLTALYSCITTVPQKKLSSSDIISKSIKFHDPNNNWRKINATMNFSSSFSFNDSIPEALELSFNTKENYFRYLNHDRKVDIEYHGDSCTLNSENGSCSGYSWTSKFYPYIWGLPMKLKDPGVIPNKGFDKVAFQGDSVWQVQVNYEAENFWFFFNPNDFQLKGFKFIKNDSTGKGEIVILKGIKEFKGIRFPQHRTWLHLDSSLIGTNEFIK